MTSHVSGTRSGATARSSERTGIGSGWVVFAAVLMVFGGLMMILKGIAAIAEDDVFVTTRNYAYAFDLTSWGWIHLIVGVVITLAGAALFQGARRPYGPAAAGRVQVERREAGRLGAALVHLPRHLVETAREAVPVCVERSGSKSSRHGMFRSNGFGDSRGGGRVACGFGSELAFNSSTRSAVRLRSRAAALCRVQVTRGVQVRSQRASCGNLPRKGKGRGDAPALTPAGPRL